MITRLTICNNHTYFFLTLKKRYLEEDKQTASRIKYQDSQETAKSSEEESDFEDGTQDIQSPSSQEEEGDSEPEEPATKRRKILPRKVKQQKPVSPEQDLSDSYWRYKRETRSMSKKTNGK